MRARIVGPETKRCPPEFQERLTRMFGTNRFGDPLFKIVWGQTETIRLGNIWRDKFGNERKGYKEKLVQFGQPCWVIRRWRAPEEYGTPALYYADTYDTLSGLYICGEYPYKGRYETIVPLYHKEKVNGRLVFQHFPLDHAILDTIIPLCIQAQRMTAAERKAAKELVEKREHEAEVNRIADQMKDAMPTYLGPTSFRFQGCRTSYLEKKMEQIERYWKNIKFQRGFFQGR
jgi:hypothetical protein